MQWTSSVSSRPASVRLRAVRTRIGLPDWSSRSGTIGEPPGSSSISSTVRFVGTALSRWSVLWPGVRSVLRFGVFSRFSVVFSRFCVGFSGRPERFSAGGVPGGACSLEGPRSWDAAGA